MALPQRNAPNAVIQVLIENPILNSPFDEPPRPYRNS